MKLKATFEPKPTGWVVVIETPEILVEENMETGERRIVKK